MKKISLIVFSVLLIALAVFVITKDDATINEEALQNEVALVSIDELKQQHKEYIDNNPYKEDLLLSKAERKQHRMPPNKYNQEQWILNMNPALGRPTPNLVAELQGQLLEDRNQELINGRVPGDAMANGWLERGPNNVGGRTRGMMFDPTDASNNTVFSGGVSGGLWKNTDISNASSVWTRVGIPENLAVSSITYDPNNPSTFYVGTGESYVGHTDGAVNGDGLWKSTDAGATWTTVFGGRTGTSYFVSTSNITVNSPAGIAGNYQSYPTTNFGPTITSTITGDFILANDATGVATYGCNSFGPSAVGKIALIRRGDCSFVIKVKNAQNAGAIGAIVLNNVPGVPVPMGGTDASITIPSVMISMADGDILEAAMASGTVNGSLNPASGDFTATVVPGVQHINDVKVRNNGGVSEIYVAAGDAVYSSSNAATTIGGLTYGLYKSVDGGANWALIDLPLTADGHKYNPNDIEVGPTGTVWMATTNSHLYGDGGGVIFSSTDGTNFTQAYAVAGGARTQIAVSSTVANKVYVLAETATGVTIQKTTTGFASVENKALPNDADTGIPDNDFTRGQAFYDLMLEVDPSNDETVYVGGIDAFKSTNGATAWTQMTKWSNNNLLAGLNVPLVHGDQHIIAFGNNAVSKIIMGNDGGVYYSDNAGTTIQSRNTGYNTSQFYTVGVAPTTAFNGDYFAGGLQDNGTQLFQNADQNGVSDSTEPYGGDGGYTFFDQDGTDRYFIRNYVYNAGINLRFLSAGGTLGAQVIINSESANNGAFINPQALDSNMDILYSNYTAASPILRRYSGIKSTTTLTKTSLTNEALTTSITALTVSPFTTSSSKLLVGTILGDVLLVTNANTAVPTWTGLDGNLLVGSVSDLEFGQSENDIFVTMHNYGVNNVWYTSNGGTTWEAKDGDLPDIPVKAILQNPLNLEEVIIGTELGVWYTNNFSNASPNWYSAFNGMSNVKVLDLDLRNDNMVFAATYGRGVFSGMFTSGSLSIEENTLASDLTLYPTASNGEITIASKSNLGKMDLSIYNLSGQLVYNSSLNMSSNSKKQLSLSLSSGLYLAKFSNGKVTETKKFIIK